MSKKDEKNCFVLIRGKRYGPYSFATLKKAAERGDIDPQSGVWCLGWPQWRAAGEVAELFETQLGSERKEQESTPQQDQSDDNNAGRETKLTEAELGADQSIEPDDRQGLAAKLGQAPPLTLWPPSPQSEPSHNVRGKVRIVVLSSLASLIFIIGATWIAVSLGVLVVEFLPQRP